MKSVLSLITAISIALCAACLVHPTITHANGNPPKNECRHCTCDADCRGGQVCLENGTCGPLVCPDPGVVFGEVCSPTGCGDTNNDGRTLASDALAVLRIAVGLPVRANDCEITACNDNGCETARLARYDGLGEDGICAFGDPIPQE